MGKDKRKMSVADLAGLKPVPELPPASERVRLRKRFHVTQETLAKTVGVSIRTIWRWETDKVIPNHPAIRDYAAVLAAWQETERQERQSQ